MSLKARPAGPGNRREPYGPIFAWIGRCPHCRRIMAAALVPRLPQLRTPERLKQLLAELGEWTIQGLTVESTYLSQEVFLEGHSETCIWEPEEWPELEEDEEEGDDNA
jgi:hypothetical protein